MILISEIPVVVSACCVLHNHILMVDGSSIDEDLVNVEGICGEDDLVYNGAVPENAESKRREIANLLANI